MHLSIQPKLKKNITKTDTNYYDQFSSTLNPDLF